MASLIDLFNPTFLMFLGILVLVVALLVIYFESKMREQNHKIASMLSLVSTLADNVENVRYNLNVALINNDLQKNAFSGGEPTNNLGNNNSNIKPNGIKLIEVSDDDDSDDESDDELDNELDGESNHETDNETNNNDDKSDEESNVIECDITDDEDEHEEEHNNIKILKFKLSNNNKELESEDANFDLDNIADLDGEFEPYEVDQPEIADNYVEEVLDLKYDESVIEKPLEESLNIQSFDLKKISINLGEEQHTTEENIDYKKLQLPKLRSIAIEKGLVLSSDASKLKKQDLLKLLSVE